MRQNEDAQPAAWQVLDNASPACAPAAPGIIHPEDASIGKLSTSDLAAAAAAASQQQHGGVHVHADVGNGTDTSCTNIQILHGPDTSRELCPLEYSTYQLLLDDEAAAAEEQALLENEIHFGCPYFPLHLDLAKKGLTSQPTHLHTFLSRDRITQVLIRALLHEDRAVFEQLGDFAQFEGITEITDDMLAKFLLRNLYYLHLTPNEETAVQLQLAENSQLEEEEREERYLTHHDMFQRWMQLLDYEQANPPPVGKFHVSTHWMRHSQYFTALLQFLFLETEPYSLQSPEEQDLRANQAMVILLNQGPLREEDVGELFQTCFELLEYAAENNKQPKCQILCNMACWLFELNTNECRRRMCTEPPPAQKEDLRPPPNDLRHSMINLVQHIESEGVMELILRIICGVPDNGIKDAVKEITNNFPMDLELTAYFCNFGIFHSMFQAFTPEFAVSELSERMKAALQFVHRLAEYIYTNYKAFSQNNRSPHWTESAVCILACVAFRDTKLSAKLFHLATETRNVEALQVAMLLYKINIRNIIPSESKQMMNLGLELNGLDFGQHTISMNTATDAEVRTLLENMFYPTSAAVASPSRSRQKKPTELTFDKEKDITVGRTPSSLSSSSPSSIHQKTGQASSTHTNNTTNTTTSSLTSGNGASAPGSIAGTSSTACAAPYSPFAFGSSSSRGNSLSGPTIPHNATNSSGLILPGLAAPPVSMGTLDIFGNPYGGPMENKNIGRYHRTIQRTQTEMKAHHEHLLKKKEHEAMALRVSMGSKRFYKMHGLWERITPLNGYENIKCVALELHVLRIVTLHIEERRSVSPDWLPDNLVHLFRYWYLDQDKRNHCIHPALFEFWKSFITFAKSGRIEKFVPTMIRHAIEIFLHEREKEWCDVSFETKTFGTPKRGIRVTNFGVVAKRKAGLGTISNFLSLFGTDWQEEVFPKLIKALREGRLYDTCMKHIKEIQENAAAKMAHIRSIPNTRRKEPASTPLTSASFAPANDHASNPNPNANPHSNPPKSGLSNLDVVMESSHGEGGNTFLNKNGCTNTSSLSGFPRGNSMGRESILRELPPEEGLSGGDVPRRDEVILVLADAPSVMKDCLYVAEETPNVEWYYSEHPEISHLSSHSHSHFHSTASSHLSSMRSSKNDKSHHHHHHHPHLLRKNNHEVTSRNIFRGRDGTKKHRSSESKKYRSNSRKKRTSRTTTIKGAAGGILESGGLPPLYRSIHFKDEDSNGGNVDFGRFDSFLALNLGLGCDDSPENDTKSINQHGQNSSRSCESHSVMSHSMPNILQSFPSSASDSRSTFSRTEPASQFGNTTQQQHMAKKPPFPPPSQFENTTQQQHVAKKPPFPPPSQFENPIYSPFKQLAHRNKSGRSKYASSDLSDFSRNINGTTTIDFDFILSPRMSSPYEGGAHTSMGASSRTGAGVEGGTATAKDFPHQLPFPPHFVPEHPLGRRWSYPQVHAEAKSMSYFGMDKSHHQHHKILHHQPQHGDKHGRPDNMMGGMICTQSQPSCCTVGTHLSAQRRDDGGYDMMPCFQEPMHNNWFTPDAVSAADADARGDAGAVHRLGTPPYRRRSFPMEKKHGEEENDERSRLVNAHTGEIPHSSFPSYPSSSPTTIGSMQQQQQQQQHHTRPSEPGRVRSATSPPAYGGENVEGERRRAAVGEYRTGANSGAYYGGENVEGEKKKPAGAHSGSCFLPSSSLYSSVWDDVSDGGQTTKREPGCMLGERTGHRGSRRRSAPEVKQPSNNKHPDDMLKSPLSPSSYCGFSHVNNVMNSNFGTLGDFGWVHDVRSTVIGSTTKRRKDKGNKKPKGHPGAVIIGSDSSNREHNGSEREHREVSLSSSLPSSSPSSSPSSFSSSSSSFSSSSCRGEPLLSSSLEQNENGEVFVVGTPPFLASGGVGCRHPSRGERSKKGDGSKNHNKMRTTVSVATEQGIFDGFFTTMTDSTGTRNDPCARNGEICEAGGLSMIQQREARRMNNVRLHPVTRPSSRTTQKTGGVSVDDDEKESTSASRDFIHPEDPCYNESSSNFVHETLVFPLSSTYPPA